MKLCLLQIGTLERPSDAFDDLEYALANIESDLEHLRPEVLLVRGSLHLQTGEPQLAVNDFEQVVVLSPRSSRRAVAFGMMYQALEMLCRPVEAEVAYERAEGELNEAFSQPPPAGVASDLNDFAKWLEEAHATARAC